MCMVFSCFSLTMGLPCVKEFYDALCASRNLYSIINRTPKIQLFTGKSVTKINGKIEFKEVCFKYEKAENFVLNKFNLTIEAAETFALCGPSGQGKSTVISLLQRFYEPESGEILIDGQNIQELNFSDVRKFISLVSQEPVLFSGTIEDNIKFGNLEATEDQIINAAQQAQIHTFIISNKIGYKTVINAGGSNLSGGQKQRIAIARAIIKDPKILLLDEATSALDREGEKEVQKAINSVKSGRTVFIIAHRLVTIQNADKIGVINQGRIWQLGNHASLMAEEGIYRSLAAADEMASKERKKKQKDPEAKKAEAIDKESKVLENVIENQQYQKNSISRSFKVIKNKMWLLFIGSIGACGNGCGYPIQGMLMIQSMETLSDYGEDYEKKNNLTSLLWFFVALYLFTIFFTQVSCFGAFSEYLTDKLRRLSMNSVLFQDVGYFDHEQNSSAKVCQRLQDDCMKVNGAAGQVLGSLFMSLFAVFGGLAVCFAFCYYVGILMIVSIPVNGLFIVTMARIEFLGVVGDTSSQETSQIASEAIVNVKTVKSCNNEMFIAQKFADTLQKACNETQYQSCSSGIILGTARFVMWGMFAMFFIFGAFIQREDDTFTFKETMIALMAALFGFFAIGDTQIYAPDMIGGKAAAISIWKTIDLQPSLVGQTENKPQLTGRIEFNKVDFKYPTRPDQHILKQFDLTIEENKTTALVGYSGNGKSTIISLILRYYEIDSGTITFSTFSGSETLSNINIYYLRSQIGLVGQEPVLFTGTVGENIQYGREGDVEKIKECARIANINLERCPLDKEVGLRGSHVSGGEKQRIAIARAIYANPKIMLLDEATSALDKETEVKVQESIQAAFKNRTVVVIAHRLSTIKEADTICVINEGKIVEQGTHNSLLSHEGLYYRLVKSMT